MTSCYIIYETFDHVFTVSFYKLANNTNTNNMSVSIEQKKKRKQKNKFIFLLKSI